MNDEPSASASSATPHSDRGHVRSPERPLAAEQAAERRKRHRKHFNKRRAVLLDDLLWQLDILVFAELSAIYYMDCSFFRFFIRAIAHLLLLTPKVADFPNMSARPPYVGTIFGTTVLCIVMHWYNNAPAAGEATRGYLHGGLAMDFIGQKGPTSKTHLIMLDLVVLLLQVVQMSAHLLRERLQAGLVSSTDNAEVAPVAAAAAPSQQSLDAEGRGLRRSAERQRAEDMEMQTLNSRGGAAAAANSAPSEEESSQRASLLAQPQRADADMWDSFNSGQMVAADLDLLEAVREQFRANRAYPPGPTETEQGRMLREIEAARALEWRGGILAAIRRARQRAHGAANDAPEP